MYSDAQTPVARSVPGTLAVLVRTISTRSRPAALASAGEVIASEAKPTTGNRMNVERRMTQSSD